MVANIDHIDYLLKSKKLAATTVRKQVLLLLAAPGRALSRKEIELGIQQHADRVTIYRTLKVLIAHNIVHRITMDDQEVKYKLIGQQKNTDHPHFYCASCHGLHCLSSELINTRHLPEGYQVHSTQLVMEGICKQCNGK